MSFQVTRTPYTPISALTEEESFVRLYKEVFSLENFNETKINYCCGYANGHKENFKALSQQIFGNLKSEASQGTLNCSITLSMNNNDPSQKATLYAVLYIFQTRMNIKVKGSEKEKLFEKPSVGHSKICNLKLPGSINCEFSWEADNAYLNPKPELMLIPAKSWGNEKRNEERLRGEGTDWTLVLGTKEFKVHSFVLKSFSDFFDNKCVMKEDADKKFILPEVNDLSEELKSDVVSYIYTKQLDLSKHAPSASIKLLEVSAYIQADHLTHLALTHIHSKAETLNPHERLMLLYTSIDHPSKELKEICSWLLLNSPLFYEKFFKMNALETALAQEDFFMLCGVSQHYKLKSLEELLLSLWNEHSTEEQIGLVNNALLKPNSSVVFLLEKFLKKSSKVITKDNPFHKSFFDHYQKLVSLALHFRSSGNF